MAERVESETVTETITETITGAMSGADREIDRGGDVLPFPSLAVRTGASESEPRLRSVIGEVLRDERHDQARTLADVADSAAVSLPYLSEVERGVKEVSSDVLAAICGALELELAEVLDRSARRLRPRAGGGPGSLALAA